MLPKSARLRRGQDFRAVMRRGSKSGKRRVVVHVLADREDSGVGGQDGQGVKVGFVVSKAVGNSVVRHRVSRRLRHLMAARLGTLPVGSALVVRALPPAASATSAELGGDLDGALRRLGVMEVRRSANDDG